MAEQTVRLAGDSGVPLGRVDEYGHPEALSVTNGQATAFTSLNAATTDTTGLVMDAGVSHQNCTMVAVGTGTLAGTLTIQGSLDNTTWVSTGTTLALTAALTGTVTATAKAFRYWRIVLSGATGTGTVTAKIMSNG